MKKRKGKGKKSILQQLNERSSGVSKSRVATNKRFIQSINTGRYTNVRLPNNNPSNRGTQLTPSSVDDVFVSKRRLRSGARVTRISKPQFRFDSAGGLVSLNTSKGFSPYSLKGY